MFLYVLINNHNEYHENTILLFYCRKSNNDLTTKVEHNKEKLLNVLWVHTLIHISSVCC